MTRTLPRILPLLMATTFAAGAFAVPPPNRPLPSCEDDEGNKVGACPKESPEVSGYGVGWISYNAVTPAYVDPQVPPCNLWHKNGAGDWSPVPCYPAVEKLEVLGCAYVDLASDRFVDAQCSRALYVTNPNNSTSLFKVQNGPTGTCGGRGSFSTYLYGGPGADPSKRWAAVGPTRTNCQIFFDGPEPDGLWGPTWLKVRAGIEVVTGPTTVDFGAKKWTEFYIPITGQLRDLGPVAGFDVVEQRGGRVTFANTSVHTTGESMTYRWDFGDGETSTETSPVHRYRKGGTYRVTLTARDGTGDEDKVTDSIKVELKLVTTLTLSERNPAVGDEVTVTVEVENPLDEAVTDFALIGGAGLRFESDFVMQSAGPTPVAPTTLGPGQTETFTFTIVPLTSGRSTIEGGALGRASGTNVSDTKTVDLVVPARLSLALTSTVTSATKVGDTFEMIGTLTNEEEVELSGIKSEPLSLSRSDLLAYVDGPTAADGSDPRVSPMTLGPGASATLKWRYKAIDAGVIGMKALVSGREPNTDALFYVSAEKRIAIETAAIEVSEARLSPGAPVPGEFGLIRATIENIGSVDVKAIDFAVEGTPKVEWVRLQLTRIEPELQPRIALLEPGEKREFLIPFGMTTFADGLGSYRVEVTMKGVADVDGEDVAVEHTAVAGGGLDLNTYWTNLLDELRKAVWDNTLDFFDGLNDWGESSTVGGVAVGGGEGVLSALQTFGDGLITTGDVIKNTVTGEYELTDKGLQIAQTVSEYYRTRSLKEIAGDFRDAGFALGGSLDDVAVAGVGKLADWMHKVDKAYQAGDARAVSALLTEAGTTIALAVGGEVAVEKATSSILSKVIKKPGVRKTVDEAYAAKAEDIVDLPPAQRAALEADDLKSLPTGVPLSRKMALRAGYSDKEIDWMQRMAKEHGVAFFGRPRPAAAAKFAEKGWNPKPMAIKFKSVNDIDVKWLGYDDYAGKEGLVVLREPKDPWPELMRQMEADEIKWGSQEIEAIVERYQRRKAEWKSVMTKLDELNSANGGEGFEILRDGVKIKTKAYLDDDGLLRFTHDNNPVYSDIDLLQVAKPDGTPISRELHEKIMKAAGPGFDVQHGDTMSTSDFPSWEKAIEFVEEYGREHMRGGDPLLIVGGDSITTGYVKSFEYPDAVAGSGYDLFGKVTVRYEGAGFP